MIQQATGLFLSQDDAALFYRRWYLDPGVRPRRSVAGRTTPVIIVHGAWEDSGLYEHVAEFFAGHGAQVWAMDLRGHGRSAGQRMYVRQFEDYLTDLDVLVNNVTWETGVRPVLVGHSMGGLICLRYALERQQKLAAVAVTSPWLRTRIRVAKPLLKVVPLLSLLVPRLPIPWKLPRAARTVNGVVRRTKTGPEKPVVTPRWFHVMRRAQEEVTSRIGELTLPLLMMQGTEDRYVWPEAMRAVFDQAGSATKTYRVYPGRYHNILHDEGFDQVLTETRDWLLLSVAPVPVPGAPVHAPAARRLVTERAVESP
ncbi:MAG: alpha/beta hydrolase [Bacillota bacterium]